MARTALLGTLAALVVTWSWLHLERNENTGDVLMWALLVGVVPALVPRLGLRIAAVALAAFFALRESLGTASPGAVSERLGDGFRTFYDVGLPFGASNYPLMHGLIELAIFGFTLAIALAVAARRPLLAAALLVAGAGWPATLLETDEPFARGAVILATALALIAGAGQAPRVRQALLAGSVVAAAAVAVAGIPAVAKGAFLPWEDWDPYRDQDRPVSVRYVWTTSLEPLDWPKKKTVVLRIKAPPVSRPWRATTLDQFHVDSGWLEAAWSASPEPVADPFLPPAARNEANLLRADVTVEALEDRHLIGTTVPVAYETDFDEILYQETGTAIVQDGAGVPRGSTYTSLSYTPRPSPARLGRSLPVYPTALQRYLVADSRYDTPPLPRFGAPNRDVDMNALIAGNFALQRYATLYDEARRIVGDAASPYLAVVRLEDHFRRSGGYRYEDDPPEALGGEDRLIDFVTRTKAGHCQYFASAMGLMLRYLGIPTRLAAGFTSGRYDAEEGEWVVVDHDAHIWVEVWFRGFGWLAFDPTPGRGTIDGAYTAASAGFSLQAVAAALGAGDAAAENFNLDRGATGGAPTGGRDVPGDVSGVSNEDEPSLLRLLALVAIALASGVSLLKVALRRARFFTRDPRRIASACRRELADFLADQRLAVPESATLAELGEIVRHEIGLNAEQFVAAVEQARYGPLDEAAPAARRARRELRRVQRAIRKQLSAWQRTRGLVSLRSFGLT